MGIIMNFIIEIKDESKFIDTEVTSASTIQFYAETTF